MAVNFNFVPQKVNLGDQVDDTTIRYSAINEVATNKKLQFSINMLDELAERELRLTRLEVSTGVSGANDDFSEIFSDADGLTNTVNTTNTTSQFKTDYYTNSVASNTQESSTDGNAGTDNIMGFRVTNPSSNTNSKILQNLKCITTVNGEELRIFVEDTDGNEIYSNIVSSYAHDTYVSLGDVELAPGVSVDITVQAYGAHDLYYGSSITANNTGCDFSITGTGYPSGTGSSAYPFIKIADATGSEKIIAVWRAAPAAAANTEETQ